MIYEDIDEAIEIANGTKYGLGASVFGPDQTLCIEVAKELECGMVAVNDFGVFYVSNDHWLDCIIAHDVAVKVRNCFACLIVKATKLLRVVKTCLSAVPKAAAMDDLVFRIPSQLFHLYSIVCSFQGGPEGLRALTNPKAIMVDRWPSLIQTSIPQVLDYPIRSLSSSWYVIYRISIFTIECFHVPGNSRRAWYASCMGKDGAHGFTD